MSYFQQDLGGGFSMNPQTGEVYDANTGQVFPDANTMYSYYESSVGGGAQPGQAAGGNPVGGIGGLALGAYGANSLFGGTPAVAAPAAPAVAAPVTGGAYNLGATGVGSLNFGAGTGGATAGAPTAAATGVGSSLASVAPYVAAAIYAHQWGKGGIKAIKGLTDDQGGNDKKSGFEAAMYSNPFSAWIPMTAKALGINLFGRGTDTRAEEKRLSKLKDKGIYGGQIRAEERSPGQIYQDYKTAGIADDFVGFDANGNWTNMKFAKSRDVKDLRPTDLTGYAAFYEIIPGWQEKSQSEKEFIAQQYLEAGAVKEKGGTINLKKIDSLKPYSAAQVPTAQSSNQGSPGMRPGFNFNRSENKYVPINRLIKPRGIYGA